ncbi:bestrophin family protein [Bordetella genomosp. 13]|uniref:bestrophin family protein n=1 Tax=Bordetella genomosp. 13 TaxID=463040 RepID=UPI00119FF4FB|nr:bestrophin family protein [Bordetella genomosp. 13]
MIVRPRPSALGLLFVSRGSIIPVILPKLACILVLSCAVGWMHARGAFDPGHLGAVPFSLFGLTLSVFLGFRNNVCYDRWWEGRRQWGELIVQARSLARESAAVLSPAEPELQARLVRRLIAHAHALAARLRDTDALAAARPWLEASDVSACSGRRNLPDALLRAINADLADCLRRGVIGEVVYQGMVARLGACAGVQAACERIQNTPTPFAYSLLLHRTAWLFCLLLPFGLVGALGLLTPLAVVIVAYTFFGLDALGDELEEPFGMAENDLPLQAMARTIEIDLLEGLGVQPLPEPLAPRDYVLT